MLRITIAAAGTVAALAALQALGTPWLVLALAALVPYAALVTAMGLHRSFREVVA
jgi:hypothetical protein